ncbi:efflux RND transporter permease subunit [Tindallia californiensis]|uniref:Hydrophobic/amphiphilic exporter-1, HAE1 family n=1 Tax=Tindallia californiensis TaxID=159292 RepID=A0A1H3MA02_9FIRM|nr:efflux RND transporter permease subunit [Tindallia californiensis]SDY73118.1 hydrophobic/amphiphilic exporter-1, HAE1 family [Tindallia californiensis]
MNLSTIAVKRPVTTIMVMLIIILLGTFSLTMLPLDLMPDIEIPVALVATNYSGVGPHEMENLVTRPIEDAVATVSDLDGMMSVSSQGNSIVVAQFDFGTDMDFAALDIRENVDMVRGILPDGASEPMVMQLDLDAMPIVVLSLSGEEDMYELQDMAEDVIKPRLERVSGVASVEVTGDYIHEIEVKVNEQRLNAYGLDISNIAQVIQASNLNRPGGTVERGFDKLTVRTMGEFKSVEEIGELPLTLPSGALVKMKDVAEVQRIPKEITSLSRTNGQNGIGIMVQKQSGTNTVQVANAVTAEIEKLQQEHGESSLTVIMDQSDFIREAINTVVRNAAVGGILAILVLYLFLRNIRSVFIIATALPISIIAAFMLLYFNDLTLNLMSLGGLALGIGMLVDNSIVVLENIYRFRTEGRSRIDAAIDGASEVSMAVTSSTLTTIAVFLPVVFVGGLTSIIFGEFAMTVTLSLVGSLVVALTLIPMLSSKILKVDKDRLSQRTGKEKVTTRAHDRFDKLFKKVENSYRSFLGWALSHRKTMILGAVLVFIGSVSSVFLVGAEFFPSADQGQIDIEVSLPRGSQLKETDEVFRRIESELAEIEEIDIVFSAIGSGMGFDLGGTGESEGSIMVMLDDLKDRDRSAAEVAVDIRHRIRDIAGAEITVSVADDTSMGGGGGAPVELKVKGDDLEVLEEITEDLRRIVAGVEGTYDTETSFTEGSPELRIEIDKYMASTYGLTTAQIADTIQKYAQGSTVSFFREGDGNELDIVVRGEERIRQDVANLQQVGIHTPRGNTVPLSQVASIQIAEGPISISREDQQRTATVSSQLNDRDLGSVMGDIQEKLEDYSMPEGYMLEAGGEFEQIQEVFMDMALAISMAIILVYMIMASLFESLMHPFTIITSLPLAFSGGFLALFVTGRTLSVPALIGFLMLSGIIINNGIVLVDYINTLRSQGKERREAIEIAGPVRLRPILMTTLTTVLAMFPMALGIGEGAETQAPMATAVIGGLLLSTVLTLLVTPVIYTITDDISLVVKNKLGKLK